MNARRLSLEDRRRIAGWLDAGLGYAEIGRRLGRPTSTISREVARNSASGRYRPGHAQEAATHRARRRRPSRPGGEPADAARGFVAEFAALLAATGLPRMTARVFTCLLTAEAGGLTSADLVRLLRVSPASVSKSVGALEAMELVARGPDPGGRSERYRIDDDVWLRAWQADTGAHGRLAAAAREGSELFGPDTTAGARLARMGRFFGRLSEQMGGSTVAEATAGDALTVVAALVHAGRPSAVDELAAALGWPRARAEAALDALRRRPAIADPLELRGAGTVTVTARPDRLSPAQREAIRRFREASPAAVATVEGCRTSSPPATST
ncbi:GbsR/MarR family transcriptional regulator [Amycolatopsis kentuckyensis]|uniref:GbsR/MarR family transcriptional regulator n=1 Tax=Amycolatopsis kentuckyensis TaxID=218823 RepID=UPI000A3D2F30|nr:helix-turn-helix domain-containing protein [Amycolatopsis kentuckyensis]